MLLFDGETGQLITAVLRPGTVHASRGAVAVLKRVVRQIRCRWPRATMEVRADSGFATPALYDYLEAQKIAYTIGLGSNSRLQALAENATHQRAESKDKVRLLGEGQYQADSWPHEPLPRVARSSGTRWGSSTRRRLWRRGSTSALWSPPEELYHWYTRRGDRPELCIKDLKEGCFADRLSCHSFWANQFRLLLHAAAYWLLDTVRR